jgi:hypothetical protein
MFLRLQVEEKTIRTNVSAPITALLEKVFGGQD